MIIDELTTNEIFYIHVAGGKLNEFIANKIYEFNNLYLKENKSGEDFDKLNKLAEEELYGCIIYPRNPESILSKILYKYDKLEGQIFKSSLNDKNFINEILNEFKLIIETTLDSTYKNNPL